MFIDANIVAAVKSNFKPGTSITIRTINKILPGRQGSEFSDLYKFVYGTRPDVRFSTFGEFKTSLEKLRQIAEDKFHELMREDIYEYAKSIRNR